MLKNSTVGALVLFLVLLTLVLVWSAAQQFVKSEISSNSAPLTASTTAVSMVEKATDTRLPEFTKSLNKSQLPFINESLTKEVHIPVFMGSTSEDIAVAKRINDTLQQDLLYGQTIAIWKMAKAENTIEEGGSHNPVFLEYEITYPTPGLISIQAMSDYCSAYCTTNNVSFIFVRSTGQLLTSRDVFIPAGWQRLGEEKDQQKKQVIDTFVDNAQTKLLKVRDEDERDRIETQVMVYPTCVSYEYEDYDPLETSTWIITPTSTSFIDGLCFPHGQQAYDDLGQFTFTKEFVAIKDYLTPLGKELFLESR